MKHGTIIIFINFQRYGVVTKPNVMLDFAVVGLNKYLFQFSMCKNITKADFSPNDSQLERRQPGGRQFVQRRRGLISIKRNFKFSLDRKLRLRPQRDTALKVRSLCSYILRKKIEADYFMLLTWIEISIRFPDQTALCRRKTLRLYEFWNRIINLMCNSLVTEWEVEQILMNCVSILNQSFCILLITSRKWMNILKLRMVILNLTKEEFIFYKFSEDGPTEHRTFKNH